MTTPTEKPRSPSAGEAAALNRTRLVQAYRQIVAAQRELHAIAQTGLRPQYTIRQAALNIETFVEIARLYLEHIAEANPLLAKGFAETIEMEAATKEPTCAPADEAPAKQSNPAAIGQPPP
jgi:hypothetical protein